MLGETLSDEIFVTFKKFVTFARQIGSYCVDQRKLAWKTTRYTVILWMFLCNFAVICHGNVLFFIFHTYLPISSVVLTIHVLPFRGDMICDLLWNNLITNFWELSLWNSQIRSHDGWSFQLATWLMPALMTGFWRFFQNQSKSVKSGASQNLSCHAFSDNLTLPKIWGTLYPLLGDRQ